MVLVVTLSLMVMRALHPDAGPVLGAAAETATTGPNPASGLVQYGALGMVTSAAIFGLTWLVRALQADHKEALKRERENIDRVQARLDEARAELKTVRAEWAAEVRDQHRVHAEELRDLHKRNETTVIPALAASHEAIRDTQTLMRDFQHLMRDLSRGGASM